MDDLWEIINDTGKKLAAIKLMRRVFIASGGILGGYAFKTEAEYDAMDREGLDTEAAELFAACEAVS